MVVGITRRGSLAWEDGLSWQVHGARWALDGVTTLSTREDCNSVEFEVCKMCYSVIREELSDGMSQSVIHTIDGMSSKLSMQ